MVQAPVSKKRSGFASFPPGRDVALAHKAAAVTPATVKAAAVNPKVSSTAKSAVKSASSVKSLVMVKKQRSTKKQRMRVHPANVLVTVQWTDTGAIPGDKRSSRFQHWTTKDRRWTKKDRCRTL